MKKASHITAAFIRHELFHTGIWLQSVERPGWYYFMEKKSRNLISNPDFAESVDPPLRELVRFLHDKSIRTTPSCSGHHFSGKNFRQIYDDLEKDEAAIRTRGLALKDVESGDVYFYRNPDYLLPWRREDFLNSVMSYQAHGVIGIRAARFPKKKKALLSLDLPGVDIREQNGIVLFLIAGNETGNNEGHWNRITQAVKKIFI